jgi:competence protein ComEC
MKYRYYFILIVIVCLIIGLRLKNNLRIGYANEIGVKQTVVVMDEPYHIGSKQIVRLDKLVLESGEFEEIEVGDVLRIEGKARRDISTNGERVRSRFDQRFRLVQPRVIKVQNEEVAIWFRILSVTARLRQRWQGVYRKVLPEPQASLVAGMTFGWNLSVQESFYRSLQTTGVLHVVAASGQNLTILAQLLLVLCLRFVSRRWATLILVAAIIGYTILSGMSPSIVRAAIMATLSFVALSWGRQQDGLWALFIAAAVMLIWRPLLIFDVGWQLSVAATAGLLLMRPKNELGVTLAAQAATLPILLVTFERLSLVSPLVNLIVAPLVPIIMVGGGLILVLGPIGGWLVWVPATVFVKIVEVMGRVPWAQVEIRGLPWWWAVGYYLLLGAIVASRRNKYQ